MSNTQLVEVIYDFAEHQRLVLGRSEATIKGYTSDLLDLQRPSTAFLALLFLVCATGLLLQLPGKHFDSARRTASVKAFSTWAVNRLSAHR